MNITGIIGAAMAASLLTITGCTPARPPGDGPLSVPDKGIVSVIAGRSNVVTADHAEWTWSVLGERNWTVPTAAGTHLALAGSYPINDLTRRHGCNTWNCELVIDRNAAAPGMGHWTLRLHGSNGKTVESHGDISLDGKDIASAVSSVADRDRNLSLPAATQLASLDGRDISVSISP